MLFWNSPGHLLQKINPRVMLFQHMLGFWGHNDSVGRLLYFSYFMRVLFATLRYLKKTFLIFNIFSLCRFWLLITYLSRQRQWYSTAVPAGCQTAGQPASQPTSSHATRGHAHPVPPVPVPFDLPASLSHFRPAMSAVWAVHNTATTEVKGKATLCFSKTSPHC